MSKARVLIAGCGQLGSRHLQAVAALPEVESIDVYDPRPEGLELGRARLAEVPDRRVDDVRWLTSLDQAAPAGDLCIVATRADVRCGLVYDVARKLGYTSFLIEKIVAQSLREYDELLEFSNVSGLAVWVNCKARANVSHRRIKAKLDPTQRIVFTAQGGYEGLANNGVHSADLFAFLDGAESIERAGAFIDPCVLPSKRGADMFDLSGTLYGRSTKRSQFILSYGDYEGPNHFTVYSPTYRAVADDMKRWFWESSPESGWAWSQVPFEQNLAVSYMSRAFVSEILASAQCELPTLKQCRAAHEFILNSLQPSFGTLLGIHDRCPVT